MLSFLEDLAEDHTRVADTHSMIAKTSTAMTTIKTIMTNRKEEESGQILRLCFQEQVSLTAKTRGEDPTSKTPYATSETV